MHIFTNFMPTMLQMLYSSMYLHTSIYTFSVGYLRSTCRDSITLGNLKRQKCIFTSYLIANLSLPCFFSFFQTWYTVKVSLVPRVILTCWLRSKVWNIIHHRENITGVLLGLHCLRCLHLIVVNLYSLKLVDRPVSWALFIIIIMIIIAMCLWKKRM